MVAFMQQLVSPFTCIHTVVVECSIRNRTQHRLSFTDHSIITAQDKKYKLKPTKKEQDKNCLHEEHGMRGLFFFSTKDKPKGILIFSSP